jgi:hypothetical protein
MRVDHRKYHSAVITLDDSMIFYGGQDSQGIINSDLRIYNIPSATWTRHSNEPIDLNSPGCLHGKS